VRVIGTLGNPNYFSLFNVGIFYWALTNVMMDRGRRYSFYVALSFAMVLLAQSRTNIVLLGVLSVVFSLVIFRSTWAESRHKAFFIKFLFVVIVTVSVFVWWMIEYGVLRYIYTGFLTVYETGLASQSSFIGRLKMWGYFLELIGERPILGYGPSKGAFEYAVADNNYIFTMFRYGLIGLIVTVTLWLYLLVRMYKEMRYEPSDQTSLALFLLVGIMFMSLFAEAMDSMRLAPLVFLLSGLALSRIPSEAKLLHEATT